MSLSYQNLDKTTAYNKLKALTKGDLTTEFTAERLQKRSITLGGGLTFNYGARNISDEGLAILGELAAEQQLVEKYQALLGGEVINTGENRKVMHHLTRNPEAAKVEFNGKDLGAFYKAQKEAFSQFAKDVHSGAIKGSTGKDFKQVVQIGIGGSDLGPRALYLALENGVATKMKAHFISNVDPDDANAVLAGLDLESTLFILVSKSGTTQETLANRNFVIEKTKAAGISGFDPSKHMVAVTSETSPLASSSDVLKAFFMDDFIGGRYSSTSAVGGVILSLAFGPEVFQQILDGAADADKLALEADILKNPALMDALLGVHERNVLGYGSTAILPYSQALSRFPAHLQQLDMESNGKQVNREGGDVDYATGPVIFGEPGTNGQHSFYQLLHQGTDEIPLQFIGFTNSQIDSDLDYEGSTSQAKLKANMIAQIVAFAKGQKDENPNKTFKGNRPSSLIHGKKLTPQALGALLAHYENKVMFQGFCWNLNSFDQEGVQLGKILTKQVLSGGEMDECLVELKKVLAI